MKEDVIACRPKQMNFKLTNEFVSNATVDIPFSVMIPQKIENLLVEAERAYRRCPRPCSGISLRGWHLDRRQVRRQELP